MEKLVKIKVLLSILFTVNILGIHGIGIGISFFVFAYSAFFRQKYIPFCLGIIISLLLNIAWIGSDFGKVAFWLVLLYVSRSFEDESKTNYAHTIVAGILLLGLFKINADYALYPLVVLIFQLPALSFSEKTNLITQYQNHIKWFFGVMLVLIFVLCLFPEKYSQKRKSGYLEKGIWANTNVKYQANDLRNASCYSYSEFVGLINADTIHQLNNLNLYTELWIVTPTIPFKQQEVNNIRKWVQNGGHLILVSDHTDLYGHARCINQLASVFEAKSSYSALFNPHDNQIFNTDLAGKSVIKTATSIKGNAIWPVISAFQWEEIAYYLNDNFFGPVTASGDDTFGNKLVCGKKAHGLGQVTFLGDSTFFSNFAVYQPFTLDFIRYLLEFSFLARFLFFAPLIIILSLLLLYSGENKMLGLLGVFCLQPILSFIKPAFSLTWNTNPQIWAGNSDFVFENICPYSNISTAYSLAVLSGRQPKWEENIEESSSKDVIWVDTVPPPNKKWRWIKIEDNHQKPKLENSYPFKVLYSSLNTQNIKSWQNVSYDALNVNAIFSDNVMNTWWYAHGISPSRQQRINAWLAWLKKEPLPSDFEYNKALFTTEKIKAAIRIDKVDSVIFTELPKPIQDTGFVYFGNGISGKVLLVNDKKAIIGQSQYDENWYSPKIWAIDYY